MPYCGLPPLDQDATRIGRGYGLGYNRDRSRADQLHAGMDFVAESGTPILAPLEGTVVLKSADTGPMITPPRAQAGEVGQVRGMGGYGNSLVLEHRVEVPGLPNPFWTSVNHMQSFSPLPIGTVVRAGDLLGTVGNTTNGQFRGMGAHLHFEVRRRPYPGSYRADTINPNVLWSGIGIDWVGGRREVQRDVGGQLLIRAGGPSDPSLCRETALSGWGCPHGWMGGPCLFCHPMTLADVPRGYIDPAVIRVKYTSKGVTRRSNQNVLPPDYAPESAMAPRETASSAAGGALLITAALVAAKFLRR